MEQIWTDEAGFFHASGVSPFLDLSVIARKGSGIHETFTVRRISYGEGVERVFPVNSPNIEKIEVDRESEIGRARLYHLRDLKGKAAMQVNVKRYDSEAAASA